MSERLTEHNETGYVLKLDNPQNEIEARQQLMQKFKLACTKLGQLEDLFEQYDIEKINLQLDKINATITKINPKIFAKSFSEQKQHIKNLEEEHELLINDLENTREELNKQLKFESNARKRFANAWKQLKEWLEEMIKKYEPTYDEYMALNYDYYYKTNTQSLYKIILDKMQELEKKE